MKEFMSPKNGARFFLHPNTEPTPRQIDQLICYTRIETDPIKLDGDENRFMSHEQFNAWRKKGRSIYLLTDEPRGEELTGDLTGIWWVGEKPLPERDDYYAIDDILLSPEVYNQTSGFRLYGLARGAGLSDAILTYCKQHHFEQSGQQQMGYWAEVYSRNAISLRMNAKMGFNPVTRPNADGTVIVTRKYTR